MFEALMMSVMPRKRGGKRGQGLHDINATYSSRLRNFWSGAWVQLLSEMDVVQQHTAGKPVNKSEGARLTQEASTIQSLIKGQAVSKAISRVSSPLEFATGPLVPQKVKDKFPVAGPLPVQPDVPDIPPDLRDELKGNILTELMQLPRMCGAGPTGTFYEHLASVRNIPGGLQLTADVLAMLITGEAPQAAIRLHRSGRCHPYIKPDTGGDIRPLVSPSALWRAAMRGWVRMFKDEVRIAVGHTQFGVATPGGCVALRNEMFTHLVLDPSLAIAPIDLQNMYGSMDIANIEAEAIHRIPRMWPLLASWIRQPREHIFLDEEREVHRIPASKGLDQGDPASSLLAPLGIATAHDRLAPHGFVLGEMDDTYLLMKPDKVADGLNAVAAAFAPSGTSVNTRKSSVWCSVPVDVGASGIAQTQVLPTILKQPLPTITSTGQLQFSSEAVNKIKANRVRLFERLAKLSDAGLPLQTVLVIARFATSGDAVYASQCQLLSHQQASQLDEIALNGIRNLLNVLPTEPQAPVDRWFLPWKEGGMGFQSVVHASPANFLAGWVRDLPEIAPRVGQPNVESVLQRAAPLEQCLQQVVDTLTANGVDDLPNVAACFQFHGTPKLASHWRSGALARCKNLIESGSTPEQVVAMKASSGSGAGAWMGVPSKQGHFLSDQEVVTATRLRMCMNVYTVPPMGHAACAHRNQQTVCGAALDASGSHALLCRLGGHVVRRHNKLRDTLAGILESVLDSTVHVEQHPPGMHEDARRPDICYIDYRGIRQWIDVSVVTPHPRSLPGRAAIARTGALCESMESTKRRKYHMLSLYPAVMEHLGHMGQGLCSLIRSVHQHSDPFQRAKMVDEAYQTMATDLQRANVTLLAAAGELKM
jgi:hypothetical protein